MQIAPEHAATSSQPWIDDARDSTGIARPPQIQAADQHHDRPRGGKFNQHRTAAPEQQFTMQTENHPGEASIFIDRAEYLQRLRMDVNAMHGRSEEHTSELQSLMRISYAVFCLKKKKRVT